MLLRKTLLVFIVLTTLLACQSKKKQAELLELSKPAWLKERPVSAHHYYGIGVTPKVGSPMQYEEKAKERALADLAKQISTQIKSETNYYKMEDNQGAHEYIQSRIKASSNAFLEGYQFRDKWEDERNVYAFYSLSKQEYARLRAERKKKAIELASIKFKQAINQQSKNNVRTALELYAASIDAISGYLNEEVSTTYKGENIDLFSESKKRLVDIVKQLKIISAQSDIYHHNKSNINEGESSLQVKYNTYASPGIPVSFNYTGGYIVNDKDQSNDQGIVLTPLLPFNNKTKELFKASIDLTELGRLVSKNLYVRQLIKQQKASECRINIHFK